jgi:radical SAM protein with 4Fe4S-binding SPASM domain
MGEVAAKPKVASVAIELTPHCNQKCDYCYNEWREDNGSALGGASTEQLLGRIDRMAAAWDIDHFTLTGGEPFARHDVFEVIERARTHGIRVQMISNGGLITEAIAARLSQLGVTYVQITLDGPDAALHEEHVGRGHFEKTLAGIRALRVHGVMVIGCIVITKKNAHRTGETLALFHSLGVRQISLSRFSPAGYAASFAAQLLCTRDELTVAFEQALPYATGQAVEGKMHLAVTMPVPPCAVEVERFAPIQFGVCPIGTSAQELALGPDGKLRNCTLHRAAIGGVADVLDPAVDLRDLLRAPEITEYRRKSPEFCAGCLHEKTCAGGCGAAAEWVLGDARATPDPFVWQHIDDAFGARLAQARDGKRRLDVIL